MDPEWTPATAPRPSAVTDWTRCPEKWYRETIQGYSYKYGEWYPNILGGQVIHAVMAEYWQQVMKGAPPLPVDFEDDMDAMAEAMVLKEWPTIGGYPVRVKGFPPREEYTNLVMRAAVATMLWCAQNMEEEEPLWVERSLRPDGTATVDLLTRNRQYGYLTVTDWKSHYSSWNKDARLFGAERSHQFHHYCWGVAQELGEPCHHVRAVHVFLTPKLEVESAKVRLSREAQADWLTGAQQKWRQMKLMEMFPAMVYKREDGCRPFGKKWACPMEVGCWDLHWTNVEEHYERVATS